MSKHWKLVALAVFLVIAAGIGTWRWYVSTHTCEVVWCTEWKVADSNYCSDHENLDNCKMIDCTNKRIDDENYCAEHLCSMEGCSYHRNDTSERGYCTTHEEAYAKEHGYSLCQKKYCCRQVQSGETYCSTHIGTCIYNNSCPGKAEDGSEYCSYHQPNQTTSTDATTGSSTSSSTKKSSSSKKSSSKKSSDTYNAKSYSDPEDFYEDHYDDFFDYEDAEDYWDDYG